MTNKIKKIQLPNGDILDLGGTGGGASMFDTKLVDHELTFEESEGWALQGTYVYKEGVAGSRYGYPTFYEKCIEEKELGTATETTLGNNTVTLYMNPNGHIFYDIADKEAVDAWYDTYGTAWYYGVDTSAERVFLPRNKWFIQPTDDVSKVNSVNEAGLPNITGSTGSGEYFDTGACSPTGAFTKRNETRATRRDTYAHTPQSGFNFDASLSNPIYGNSDTVQPQSLNQLLYICVGNTSVNEALTDVIDITTSENDTLPLGYSTYQADNLSSAGWLKSTGFFESGLTYVTFYNEYRTRIGDKFSGGFVRSIDDTYTDYDLVIDEANQMFRLPLLDGSECIADYNTATNISLPYTVNYNGVIVGTAGVSGSSVNILVNGVLVALTPQGANGTICAPVKSGDIVTISNTPTLFDISFVPYIGNGSLYYKVANAVQHLEVIDMLHQAELNNPFFYGMYQYFQTEPNNASWLASLGQWNSKGIYTDYYNWILENVGKDYFKLSTEEYTDYDWVVNTTDETFRLPIKVKGASGSAVVGNGMTLGLNNGEQNFGLLNNSGGVVGRSDVFGLPVGSNGSSSVDNGQSFAVTTDPTKSGIETSTDGLTLYFYVGEVLQSANLINAGRALERMLTRGNKEEIMGWLMPDYSAGVSQTVNVNITATQKGFVYLYTNNKTGNLYINGVDMGHYTWDSGVYHNYNAVMFPVSEGDVYKATAASKFIFYPCKGVN